MAFISTGDQIALGSPSGTLDLRQNVCFPPAEGRVVRVDNETTLRRAVVGRFTIGDFPIQFSLYTSCRIHHVFWAWGACILPRTCTSIARGLEWLLFIHFRCNCACSVNGQWNVELKQCFSEVFVFVPLDKVTKAEETEYQSEFREARTSGIRPAQRSWFLVLTRGSGASGDKNETTDYRSWTHTYNQTRNSIQQFQLRLSDKSFKL